MWRVRIGGKKPPLRTKKKTRTAMKRRSIYWKQAIKSSFINGSLNEFCSLFGWTDISFPDYMCHKNSIESIDSHPPDILAKQTRSYSKSPSSMPPSTNKHTHTHIRARSPIHTCMPNISRSICNFDAIEFRKCEIRWIYSLTLSHSFLSYFALLQFGSPGRALKRIHFRCQQMETLSVI